MNLRKQTLGFIVKDYSPRVFTTEAQRSQRSEYFYEKFFLRALSASAVRYLKSFSPRKRGVKIRNSQFAIRNFLTPRPPNVGGEISEFSFTTETQSSQRSASFLNKNSFLRALSASAVRYLKSFSPRKRGAKIRNSQFAIRNQTFQSGSTKFENIK